MDVWRDSNLPLFIRSWVINFFVSTVEAGFTVVTKSALKKLVSLMLKYVYLRLSDCLLHAQTLVCSKPDTVTGELMFLCIF